jgi:hypothetical protein
VDPAYRRLSVGGPQGSREVSVTDATQIWLDRTQLGLTNTEGSLSDCRPQQQVEVKLADDGRTAVWIKVRMPDAPGP